MSRPGIDTGHTCFLPRTSGDKRWFTCPECGQLWRLVERVWKLTAREEG